MSSITSANSILMLGVTSLFAVPQQIQGFATDDMFDFDVMERAEAQMGVDGRLTGGWVAVPLSGSLSLQGDSPSNDFFDAWNGAQVAQRDIYYGFGTLTLPSLGKKYTFPKGILRTFQPIVSAGKTFKPRKFAITREGYTPAPI